MSGIMIVEDNVVSVMELEEALRSHSYELAGVASSGLEAVSMQRETEPDLILMDIKMPGTLDGISAAEQILSYNDIPIIFVTGYDDEEILERASHLNPAGYILKPFVSKQIIAAVRIALRGRKFRKRHPWIRLTPCEMHVAELIREGKSSKEIAGLLKLSKRTIDWHRANIRKAFHLSSEQSLFSYLREF